LIMAVNRVYDLLIIGAGSVGVPTALYAAEAGLKVLVLEARHAPGQGQHKRAIGGIRATHSEPAKIALSIESLDIFSHFTEETGKQIHWRRGGYFFPAYTDKEEQTLKKVLKVQQAQGLKISWVDAAQVDELVPGMDTTDLHGGTYAPEDGSASPIDSMAAFYLQARESGVEFIFDEHVTEILHENERLVGVRTKKDIYHCRYAINCAGVAASKVAALAGTDLPINPDMHEAGITEPMGHFFDPMVVDIRQGKNSKNIYFYQNEIGQVVFCLTPDPPMLGEDRRSTSEFLPLVARRMVKLLPRLSEVKVRRVWRGLYPNSPDGSPFIDRDPNVNGFFHAAGMCGQGFMLGPGIGRLMSRWLTDRLTQTDKSVLHQLKLGREYISDEVLK